MHVNTRYINSTSGTSLKEDAPMAYNTLHFRHRLQPRCAQAQDATNFYSRLDRMGVNMQGQDGSKYGGKGVSWMGQLAYSG